MRRMKSIISSVTICIAVFAGVLSIPAAALEKSDQPPVSPAWVFDHWVWEDDVNTEQAVWDLVNGYEKNGIPVGAVVIDSPWATEYNNFVFNKMQYPDPEKMIKRLNEKGIRVVLWMTAMFNVESPGGIYEPKTHAIYDEAKEKGYLCNDGETYKWWKGKGAFIDYTNPEAVAWWHGLQDRVIDMGVDGWKVDGIDPMFPANGYCKSGPVSTKQYKDMYYMDAYEYIASKRPGGVGWARPVDILLANPKGFAPVSHSAVNWVGDERHNWGTEGFIEALEDIFDSARLGYTVVGSDIAGYHGDEEVDKQILIRWAQFGAMCPLMENGGHGKHQPWLHDEETVSIYRRFTKLHLELKPYLYSMMMKGHLRKGPIMHPVQGKWQYVLGDNIFVSVMHTPQNTREIVFPKGRWLDYWTPSNFHESGARLSYDCPLDKYPIFIREGAIIPLYVVDAELGHGDESFAGKVTLDIYSGGQESVFNLCEEGSACSDVKLVPGENGAQTVFIENGSRGVIVRMLAPKPKAVSANGAMLTESNTVAGLGARPGEWAYDAQAGRLYINPGVTEGAMEIEVK